MIMKQIKLNEITALSHEFGTPDYVKGGGGNTSIKTGNILWIKPSGTTLAGLHPGAFVPLDRDVLHALYNLTMPDNTAAREERVKQHLQSAVMHFVEGRPSVETPVHDLLRATHVVHTHPPLVNGLTCAVDGEAAARRLFPDALWIPYTDPGYVLAMKIKREVDAYEKTHGMQPSILLLQNHGVFVAADSAEEVRHHYERIMDTLRDYYEASGVETHLQMGRIPDQDVLSRCSGQLSSLLGDDGAGVAWSPPCPVATGPLTPDHMVYAKAFPFTGQWNAHELAAFRALRGYVPRIFPAGDALFATGVNQTKASTALTLALDGALVIQLSRAFGGPRYMDEAARSFIESWEVESYREAMLAKS